MAIVILHVAALSIAVEHHYRHRGSPAMIAVAPTATAATPASTATPFSWTKQWYPMAFVKATDKELPTRVELFGEPIALWFDHTVGTWAAMADACPHRLAPLSEGRVDAAGQIECPYHGWTFSATGA